MALTPCVGEGYSLGMTHSSSRDVVRGLLSGRTVVGDSTSGLCLLFVRRAPVAQVAPVDGMSFLLVTYLVVNPLFVLSSLSDLRSSFFDG